ncbi:MAG: ATP-dependent protease ATPase subunit HslU [Fimbriimonadaceae bacterium]
MHLPIEDLTPRQIVAELDRYIVGQSDAKKAVAVALRNRFRRQRVPANMRDDILPKNILMIGPTGVGKTEIARRLAQIARAPFIKVEATKFTEVGYVGRDVDAMVRDLAGIAVRLVEREKFEEVRPVAETLAIERLVDMLEHLIPSDGEPEEEEEEDWEKAQAKREQKRYLLRRRIEKGEFDRTMVEVNTEEAGTNFLQVFTNQGIEEMGLDAFPHLNSTKTMTRKVTVLEAKEVIIQDESSRLVDTAGINREAIERAEQTGIIFIDEIDKVAGKSGGSGPDVSREGVQRDLLPVIEGSTVQTKYGPLRTDHILFIAAGAFHISSPQDLIPELQGRLPIRVQLESLGEFDFRRILKEPENSLVRQYTLLLAVDGVDLEFDDSSLDEVARLAMEMNKVEDIGARRLHTMMERLLEKLLFEAPEGISGKVVVDKALVEKELVPLINSAKGAMVL